MRVLHVPYTYYPDPVGGTEVYVAGLAAWQRVHGCEVAIAAPGDTDSSYRHADMPVWRFAAAPVRDLRDLYGDGNPAAAEAFGRILDEYCPDVVHLHALTRATSVRLVEQVKARRIPVVFNYHTPTVSCPRGSLLRWGAEICDGKLDLDLCTPCAMHGNGLPRPVAKLLSAVPKGACRQLGNAGLSGGVWTALRLPDLVDVRIQVFRRLIEMVDHVVALCDWTRDLLLRNGVPAEKITLSRQGIAYDTDDQALASPAGRPFRLPLRAAFLGRLDPTKGAHVIIQALKESRNLPVEPDLFGVCQGTGSQRYAAELAAAMSGDARIRMFAPIPSDQVVRRLSEYDFVVIPSQWLETGPLVVLEAFAARTPVIGSKLGGIAELVTHEVDGLLVEPADSPAAWAESLRRICMNPGLLALLRTGIRPPTHIKDAARDATVLYERLMDRRQTRAVLLPEGAPAR
jgi:glycosyltransferase involved in cell wall biosynthesis